jgi:hypothetical protein
VLLCSEAALVPPSAHGVIADTQIAGIVLRNFGVEYPG